MKNKAILFIVALFCVSMASSQEKLIFAYDKAGNQKQRFYCPQLGCAVPDAPEGKANTAKNIPNVDVTSLEKEVEAEKYNEQNFEDDFVVYPNPTSGKITIQVEQELLENINSIRIFDANSSLVKTLKFSNGNNTEVDLTNIASGVYFLHIHFNEGKSVTKQIIKN